VVPTPDYEPDAAKLHRRVVRNAPARVRSLDVKLIANFPDADVAERSKANEDCNIRRLRNLQQEITGAGENLFTDRCWKQPGDAPVIVEKIAKKARSLSAPCRPGMNGSIWSLYFTISATIGARIAGSARPRSGATAGSGQPRSG
jgi:hypothetical protein